MRTILERARRSRCDLIVIAAREPGLWGALFGTLPERLARAAKCRVLVVDEQGGETYSAVPSALDMDQARLASYIKGRDTVNKKIGSTHFDLLEVLRGETCPLCVLTHRLVASYLETISYEAVNDPPTRAELRAALGFCPMHSWEWMALGDTLGTAIIYQDILRELSHRLAGLTPSDGGGLRAMLGMQGKPSVESALVPTAPCPACKVQSEAQGRIAAVIAELTTDRGFMEAYELSKAKLCLAHLRTVLARISDPDGFARLVASSRGTIEQLLAQLGEVIRKHDYRFRDEPVGNEAGAPNRAVKHLAGMRDTLDKERHHG